MGMKKLAALVMALMLCLTAVSAMAAEAKIGNTEYDTVQEAFNNANGNTIILMKDVELSEGITISAGKTVTLDLNGYTLSGVSIAAASSAVITNHGNLTIMDSRTGGKITSFAKNPDTNARPSYANNTITNRGTLTLISGIIENATGDDARACYPIDNNSTSSDAIVNIKGGTVTGRGAIRQFANSTSYENTVNITGGTVAGTSYGVWMQNPSDDSTGNNTKEMKAALNISSGDVAKLLLEPSDSFESSITGGEIKEVAYWQPDNTNDSRNLSGIITGGIFETDPGSFVKTSASVAQVEAGGQSVYAIGAASMKEAVEEAVAGGKSVTVTVTKGDVTLDNLPAGTAIENIGTGTVVANGVDVGDFAYVIPAPISADLPQTGDNTSLLLWASLLALAGVGFVVSRKTRLN